MVIVPRSDYSISAERLIEGMKPSVILSNNSTAIMNVKLMGYEGDVYAYKPMIFARLCNHNSATGKYISDFLKRIGVVVYE